MSDTNYDMEASGTGVDMVDDVYPDATLWASLFASGPGQPLFDTPQPAGDHLDYCDPELPDSLTFTDPELTTHVPGETTTHHNNSHGAPVPQIAQFDPRALLNPKSANPKRPASSGGDADRGRIEPANIGQVSLVERLHNIQERTASPAKRFKTGEVQTNTPHRTNFSGGSALDPRYQQNSPVLSPPQQKPSIDLTMSEYKTFMNKTT